MKTRESLKSNTELPTINYANASLVIPGIQSSRVSDSGARNRERNGAKKIWEILLVLLPPFNSAILEPDLDLFVLKKRDSCKIIGTNDHFAQYKVIRIPEVVEFLLLESGITGFGIVEFSSRNPESRLRSDSGIHSPQFPSRFYSANRMGPSSSPGLSPHFLREALGTRLALNL